MAVDFGPSFVGLALSLGAGLGSGFFFDIPLLVVESASKWVVNSTKIQ